jgi:hypothetical protein
MTKHGASRSARVAVAWNLLGETTSLEAIGQVLVDRAEQLSRIGGVGVTVKP